MDNIVNKSHVAKIDSLTRKIGEMVEDSKKLENLQIIGKHGNVLMDFDTGMGMTIEDLAKEHPDIYKMLKNLIALNKIVDEEVGGIFV